MSQSTSANSISTGRSSTSNKESKVGKLEQRFRDGHALKLALREGYQLLLMVMKMLEKYYEKPLKNGIKRLPKLEQNFIQGFIEKKGLSWYSGLPNIEENMTNKQIDAIINKQKTKMKQGILRGQFKNFRMKSEELKYLEKQKAPTTKQRELLKHMRNNLLQKNPNLGHLKDSELTIKQFFKKSVEPLKVSLKKFEEKTKNMIRKKKEINEARDERKKKQAKERKHKAIAKLFVAKLKKRVREQAKATKKNEEIRTKQAQKNAKEIEKAERQKAKDAEDERKKAAREEKTAAKAAENAEKKARKVQREIKAAAKAVQNAEKEARKAQREMKAAKTRAEKELRKAQNEAEEAIMQAAILTAGAQMSNNNLATF